ncbi:MAG: putative ABC transporter permease, partial [Anaerovoracaceae bacterium]
MDSYSVVWYFLIYGFLGWVVEVCFHALAQGKLVNRGFLNGAICPIYGFGVVLVVWILEPVASHGILLFAGATVLCSVLEWITGFILAKAFHQRWWDYTDEPLNIGGYICLRFSLMWGLACVFVVKLIHPSIQWLLDLVP